MNTTQIIPRKHKLYPQISVTDNTDGSRDFVIAINSKISSPDFFVYAIQTMLRATENDKVTVLINTPGGDVDAGLGFINAMKRCQAPITTQIVGYAYSCGAMIWSFGDNRLMGKFARGMFHSSSHGQQGKTRSLAEAAVALETRIKVLYDEIIERGVLSESQVSKIFDNKIDYYFTSETVNEGRVTEESEDED